MAIYGLVLYATTIELAIIPLTPFFANKFSLSDLEAGALLACVSLTLMVSAGPLGRLSDHVGSRAMTAVAGLLFVLTAIGQGAAPNFPVLLLSWAGFGIAAAVIFTGGLAWLSDSISADRRARALGASVAIGGIGTIIGPLFGGASVEHLGTSITFGIAAGIAALLTMAVLLVRVEVPRQALGLSLAATLRASRGELDIVGGLALIGLLGLAFGVLNVVIPLRLDEHGLSTAEIGYVYAASAVLFVAVSAFVARLGSRASTIGVAAGTLLVQAALLMLPIMSTSAAILLIFLVLRAPIWGISATICYPLCAQGAISAGLGRGAIFGLLNAVWGVSAVAGPLLGGFMAQTIGDQWAYVVLLAACVCGALFLRSRRSGSTRVHVPKRSALLGQTEEC